ncbi:hypothetical protein [Desulfovibrio litoralis]|uniref:Uncharacterized protein n=1 Tax=Desulfovibrio litoralis DSM 11393 TaxID=1121455 RepID=A0A1M7S0I4_9BACT|nr:hypothetical protein [Desulfovibrio litoralis]SHN51940.1 hypothetical protein SAMN02745728_00399 [Desulfovibrio litoralis DSM 11393]
MKQRPQVPNIPFTIKKVALVARDYNIRYPNGYRDFSHTIKDTLLFLDNLQCDTILFSLYSIIPKNNHILIAELASLTNVKMICLEEFKDFPKRRKPENSIIYYNNDGWKEYRFKQKLAKISTKAQVEQAKRYAEKELPFRIFGNCCVLICGETNIVKYDKKSKTIVDYYGLERAIPPNINIILNPIHDKMTRFEMVLKRAFLSQNGRTVLSVWNKGKIDRNGMKKDGIKPPWTVYKNGSLINIEEIPNDMGLNIGVVDMKKY